MNQEQIIDLITSWLPVITAVGGVVSVLLKMISSFRDQYSKIFKSLKEYGLTNETSSQIVLKAAESMQGSVDQLKELNKTILALQDKIKSLEINYEQTVTDLSTKLEEQLKKDANRI